MKEGREKFAAKGGFQPPELETELLSAQANHRKISKMQLWLGTISFRRQ